jgi:hypothetical protein
MEYGRRQRQRQALQHDFDALEAENYFVWRKRFE